MILFLWADLASSSLPRPEGENSFRCAAGKVAVIGVEGDEDRILSYRVWGSLSLLPCISLVNNQPQLSIVLHYSYRKESLSVWRESFFLNQECLNWINSLISHNSSGHAFSSLLSILPYAMMEMEYLGSAEF